MNFPSALSFRSQNLASLGCEDFISSQRDLIKRVVSGKDPRIALVLGPCSIHNSASAKMFAQSLKNLQDQVSDTFLLVMRTYVEKPRTALGWKGFLYDPFLDGTNDILAGIRQTRELLIDIAEIGVPCAAEFVDPFITPYYEDLISWGFIGARTSASPPHRQLASMLNFSVGFKNGLDGSLDDAIYGVLSSASSQVFPMVSLDGHPVLSTSNGNPFAHIVLRGSLTGSNYSRDVIQEAVERLEILELCPRLMIDCSHGNCERQFEKQEEVFVRVLENYLEGNYPLLGLMLECHIEEGSQPMKHPIKNTISITDPCLSWEATEEMILNAHALLRDYIISGLGSTSISSSSS